MNIYIYSDESGVFDKVHNEYFVFGGVVFLSEHDKSNAERKYINAENAIRKGSKASLGKQELKACKITNKQKGKLYRSLNQVYKFGVVVRQDRVINNIFECKKSKQRYLDYVYKIATKRFFEKLIQDCVIDSEKVERLFFYVDEHTTATNGCYELQQALENEFRYGTYNYNYSKFYPPIFPNLVQLQTKYCNSETKTLVRAADIVANNIYHKVVSGKIEFNQDNPFVILQP